MLLKRGIREKQGKLENEKWKENRDLEIKLLIGLKCKLGSVAIFHFSAPAPRFSNIQFDTEMWLVKTRTTNHLIKRYSRTLHGNLNSESKQKTVRVFGVNFCETGIKGKVN